MADSKPNFLIVGAAKSGTTALADYLRQHPDIYIPQIKEPRYFVSEILSSISEEDPQKEYIIETSTLTRQEYYKLFQGKDCFKFRGEASVHYLYYYKSAIPKIREELGDIHIVILLRHPVQRAISNYFYQKRERRSFEDALANEPARKAKKYNCFWFYKDLGFYHHQIVAYKHGFSNVKVLLYDRFEHDPQNTCNDVFQFLGLKAVPVRRGNRVNVTKVPRSKMVKRLLDIEKKATLPKKLAMNLAGDWLREQKKKWFIRPDYKHIDKEQYNMLIDEYSDEVDKLESEFNCDLSSWKKHLC